MNLPSNEYTFSFNDKGERTKTRYEGKFTVRCILTMQEIVDVGLKIDELNRGSKTLAPGVGLINRAFAELDIRVLKAPSWWKDSNNGRDLLDLNIVLGVFEKAMDAETEFSTRLEKAAEEADAAAETSLAQAKEKAKSTSKTTEKEA